MHVYTPPPNILAIPTISNFYNYRLFDEIKDYINNPAVHTYSAVSKAN